MVLIMFCGALAGAGVLLAVVLLLPLPGSPGAELARLDADRRRAVQTTSLVADRRHDLEDLRLRKLGSPVVVALATRGVGFRRLKADLGMIGRSLEMHIAQSIIGAVVGLFGLTAFASLLVYTVGGPLGLVALIAPPLGFILGLLFPSFDLRKKAGERRRDFRHVVGSFLDLVTMNLAGGRGVPEALTAASSISTSWAMIRLRDALENARLQGVTPWAAMGALGEELNMDELRDLSATLTLVADDGAKVRDSLAARAASMRTRELAEQEGLAQANSQSMLVAQLLLCLGFLIFLIFPAIYSIIG